MADTSHIRGDTFMVTGTFGLGSLVGWTGRSQVRDEITDALLTELQFVWLAPVMGNFVIQATAEQTARWPAGENVVFDVQVTSPAGVVVSSAPVRVAVMKDITQNG